MIYPTLPLPLPQNTPYTPFHLWRTDFSIFRNRLVSMSRLRNARRFRLEGVRSKPVFTGLLSNQYLVRWSGGREREWEREGERSKQDSDEKQRGWKQETRDRPCPCGLLVSGFEFRVLGLGFGFRVSGLGFWGFGVWDQGLGVRGLGSGSPGFGVRVAALHTSTP